MIKKIEHVALIVKDMGKSIDYYCEMFGFKLRVRGQSSTREMAFLCHENQLGFEIELIRDIVSQGEYAEKSVVNHLAFTVDNISKSIAFYRDKGIVFNSDSPNTAIDGAKTIFFYGPNRELLQLVEPSRRKEYDDLR